MDVSNLAKTSVASPVAVKVAKDSVGSQSPATVGSSLPDTRQPSVRVEAQQAANPTVNPASPPNSEELNNLVDQANVTMQGRSSDLKFTVAEGTDISVVRIEDAETGELIRQVPSEAMVAIARALDDAQRGMVLEEKA